MSFSLLDVEARKVINVYSSVTNPTLQNIRFDGVPFVPDVVIVRSINYSITVGADVPNTYFIVSNLIDGDCILGSFLVGGSATALSLGTNNPETVFTLRKPVSGTSFSFQVMENSVAGAMKPLVDSGAHISGLYHVQLEFVKLKVGAPQKIY